MVKLVGITTFCHYPHSVSAVGKACHILLLWVKEVNFPQASTRAARA